MSEPVRDGAILSGEDEEEEEEEAMRDTSSGVVLEGEDDSEEEEEEEEELADDGDSYGHQLGMTSPHQGEVTLGEDDEEEEEDEDEDEVTTREGHSTTQLPKPGGYSHGSGVNGMKRERSREEIVSEREDRHETKDEEAPAPPRPEETSKGVFGKFKGLFKKKKKEGDGEQKGALSRFAGKLFKSSKKPEPQAHTAASPPGEPGGGGGGTSLLPPPSKGTQSSGLGVKVAVGSLWRKSKKVLGIAGKKDKRILMEEEMCKKEDRRAKKLRKVCEQEVDKTVATVDRSMNTIQASLSATVGTSKELCYQMRISTEDLRSVSDTLLNLDSWNLHSGIGIPE